MHGILYPSHGELSEPAFLWNSRQVAASEEHDGFGRSHVEKALASVLKVANTAPAIMNVVRFTCHPQGKQFQFQLRRRIAVWQA
jgi:hypothetical protein